MNRSLRVSKAHRPRFQTVGLHAVSEELNSTYVQFRKSCTAPAETFTSDVDPNTLHVTAPPTARHSASTLAGDGLRWNKTRDIITHETRVPRSQRTACSVREVRLQWCMCLTQHELAVQKKTVVTHYTTMTENGCTRESFESGEKHEGSVYIESKAGWKRHTYRARRPRKVLRLHKRRGPDITSAVIYYLKQTGDTCTKKRLALSVVGEDSAYTRVKSVLRKLSHVFNVAKTQKLILSSSGGAGRVTSAQEAKLRVGSRNCLSASASNVICALPQRRYSGGGDIPAQELHQPPIVDRNVLRRVHSASA
ncbi:unnamed protein product [Rangifer tarandus platyrhynchus]|uniref:Uncharacterized protein n=1 Tax=Rangifer tarandus platyrhynchus TaxID=3082113 RepID=A0ACB1KG12_RANTA